MTLEAPKPLGLATVLVSADPDDFTPYAWNRASRLALEAANIPEMPRAKRSPGIHIDVARERIRELHKQGLRVNGT